MISMIESILPSTKSKVRILKTIYENPGINITHVINKTKTSPTRTTKYIDILAQYDVIEEKRAYGKNKSYMRLLKPNLSSDIGKMIFAFIEMDKKYNFLKKYKKLKPIIDQLSELFEDTDTFCLIHGSFARFSADEDSDIDIFMVGKIDKEKRERISEIMVSLDRMYSIQVESKDEFIKNIDDPFHQTVLEDHVVIFNENKFIDCLSKVLI